MKFKKIIKIIMGIILVCALLFAGYFYLAFNGNPVINWIEKNRILDSYEDEYGLEFRVYDTSYDWKRNEYSVSLGPEGSDVIFKTSTSELGKYDRLSQRLAEAWLEGRSESALDNDYSYLNYTIRAHESILARDCMEKDMARRLANNQYIISISWAVDEIDEDKIDNIAESMAQMVFDKVEEMAPDIEVYINVNTKVDYYSKIISPLK